MVKVCERCGNPLNRGKRFCSLACRNKTIKTPRSGPDAPNWKGGIQTYRRHRKDACERCGSTANLIVHHKDEDRYNNELSNLETLCRRCHQIHHKCWEKLPRGSRGGQIMKPQACMWCGHDFYRKAQQNCCSFSCARARDHALRKGG